MRIAIFSLFPEMFEQPLGQSIVGRARTAGLLQLEIYNFRDAATDRHRTVDDYPYGGGAGMVCKPEPLFTSVEAAALPPGTPVILLTPQGAPFTQRAAERLAACPTIALICGHYEGVDERVRTHLATEELSIGDYVLSGGEPAAIVVVDAVTRLLPGAIDPESVVEESHHGGLLEYPHYTRPASYRGLEVPEILLSGHHAAIAGWRRLQSIRRTYERRPDLLDGAELTPKERQLVAGWNAEAAGNPPLTDAE